MKNQRGEVVTGLMVAMMVAMMIWGGMHMMHGGHKSEGDHKKNEHKQGHEESVQHMHNSDNEQVAAPNQKEGQ